MRRDNRMRGSLLPAFVLCALLTSVGIAGCDDSEEGRSIVDLGRETATASQGAALARVEQLDKRRKAFVDGWRDGYAKTWRGTVERERTERPAAFRGSAARRAALWTLLLLVLGLLARLALASSPQRWTVVVRREADEDDAKRRGPEDRRKLPTIAAVAARGALRGLRKVLRLAAGPEEDVVDGWVGCYREARDAQRHLTAAGQALPEDDATRAALEPWLHEVVTVCERLEPRAAGGLASDSLYDALVANRKLAEELRVDILREVTTDAPIPEARQEAWTKQLAARPSIPDPAAAGVAKLPTWVRPLGWAGAGGCVLALFAMALWAAAGALPAVIAVMVAAGAVGVSTASRLQLSRADGPPLWPGAADQLAKRLVVATAVAGFLVLLSAMTSPESGLNLGQPPYLEPVSSEFQAPAPPEALLPGLAPAPLPVP